MNSRISRLENFDSNKEALIKEQNGKIIDLQIELKKRNIVIYKLKETETSAINIEENVI